MAGSLTDKGQALIDIGKSLMALGADEDIRDRKPAQEGSDEFQAPSGTQTASGGPIEHNSSHGKKMAIVMLKKKFR